MVSKHSVCSIELIFNLDDVAVDPSFIVNIKNSSSTFAIWNASSTALSVTNGGRLGMGTTSPGALFSLAATTSVPADILLSGINTIYASSSTSTIPALTINAFSIATSTTATPIFTIDSTIMGRVGIGTTSPWGTFSIEEQGTTTPVFVIGDMGTSTPSFMVDGRGFISVGTTTPGTLFSVQGIANFAGAGSTLYSTLTLPVINATSTTASSTFGNGINLTNGCYAINGACIGMITKFSSAYATSSAGTTTVAFTGADNSNPSWVTGSVGALTIQRNVSYYVVEAWGGGGGGGAVASGAGTTGSTTCYSQGATACGGGAAQLVNAAGGTGGAVKDGAISSGGAGTLGIVNMTGGAGGVGATSGNTTIQIGYGGNGAHGGGQGGTIPITTRNGNDGAPFGGGGSGGVTAAATGGGGGGGGYSMNIRVKEKS